MCLLDELRKAGVILPLLFDRGVPFLLRCFPSWCLAWGPFLLRAYFPRRICSSCSSDPQSSLTSIFVEFVCDHPAQCSLHEWTIVSCLVIPTDYVWLYGVQFIPLLSSNNFLNSGYLRPLAPAMLRDD